MSWPDRSDSAAIEAEALRRRLYLPGADAQDLERFKAAAAASARFSGPDVEDPHYPGAADADDLPVAAMVAAAGPAHARPPVRNLPRRRLLLIGIGGAMVATAAAVGTSLTVRTPEATEPAPDDLEVNGQDRGELLANLRRGGAAGIGAYLLTHRSPPALRTAIRVFTVEHHGVGRGSAALSTPGLGREAGRATVLVTASEAGPVSWRILRLDTADGTAVRLLPLLVRGGDQAAGALTTATVTYATGLSPVRIEVDVPEGVRWGAAVVYSD